VNGAETIIAVSSLGNLFLCNIDANGIQAQEPNNMGYNLSLVRYFDEMPDTIFTAAIMPNNQSML
jgi:hypothetical protein